jgi:hypothetical protein
MSCKGLEGKQYRKCMKAYVKQSKRTFPSFNKDLDTVSTAIRTNNEGMVERMRNNKRNFVVQRNLKGAVKERIVKSNDPNDKYPFKLKVLKKKKNK